MPTPLMLGSRGLDARGVRHAPVRVPLALAAFLQHFLKSLRTRISVTVSVSFGDSSSAFTNEMQLCRGRCCTIT